MYAKSAAVVNYPGYDAANRRTSLKLPNGIVVPSIFATRADYLEDDDPTREMLLVRAHASAEARTDAADLVYVAQSLAELYWKGGDLPEADRWLTRMREHLSG
jgi:hypothetical protein